MRPFGGDRWWTLGLMAALAVALLVVAVLLVDRRDVGRGVWPERRGHARGRRGLLSPRAWSGGCNAATFLGLGRCVCSVSG